MVIRCTLKSDSPSQVISPTPTTPLFYFSPKLVHAATQFSSVLTSSVQSTCTNSPDSHISIGRGTHIVVPGHIHSHPHIKPWSQYIHINERIHLYRTIVAVTQMYRCIQVFLRHKNHRYGKKKKTVWRSHPC